VDAHVSGRAPSAAVALKVEIDMPLTWRQRPGDPPSYQDPAATQYNEDLITNPAV